MWRDINQLGGDPPLTENCTAKTNHPKTPICSCWQGFPGTHTRPIRQKKIQQRSQKTVWIENLISESAQALLVTLSVLTTSQSCWWLPPPFCAPFSFSTFGWRLGCKHSLLLGFRGRIHSGGGLVVVGWGIVHVRSSSADVHPCKWCRRVKICQEVSPERMRIHLWN